MDLSTVALYLCCTLAIVGALGTVTLRHPVHACVSLLFSMLFLAGAYAMLQAHLLAALQILIYAGAIIILIVYVIMLLDLKSDGRGAFRKAAVVGVPLLLVFVALCVKLLVGMPADALPALAASDAVCAGGDCETDCEDLVDNDGDGLTDCNDPDCGATNVCFGTVRAVGSALLGRFVLPFEVSSVLLLAGIVGSILLTAPDPDAPRRSPRPDAQVTIRGTGFSNRSSRPDAEEGK